MKKFILLVINHLIISTVFISIIFSIAIYTFYLKEKDATRISKENIIKTIADFKINQINAWYVDEVLDVDLISKDETLAQLLKSYIKNRNDFNKKHLLKYLNQMKTEHLYSNVMLVSFDGKLILSTNSKIKTTDAVDFSFLKKSLAEDKSLNTDLFNSVNEGKIFLDFIAAVKDNKNNKLAGLICRKDPDDFLNPLIKTWSTTTKTAETFLVKNGSNLKKYKYNPNQKFKSGKDCWQLLSEKDSSSSRYSNKFAGFVYGENESGVDYCSYISPIPDTPWFIVLKVDTAELYKDFNANMTKLVIIAILFIIACLIGVSLLNKTRKEKYLKNLLAKEMELRQYQERFNMTMYLLAEGVFMFKTEDLVILMTNPKMNEMFGYELDELTGKNIETIFAPNHRNQDQKANAFVLNLDKNKVQNTELYNIRKDGTTFWTSARVYLLSNDKSGPVWIVVLQDITDKKKYEEKLIQSEASYKAMFENNPHPMWVYDTETLCFLSVNNTAIEKYGYTSEEFLSMTIHDIIPNEDFEGFNNFIDNKIEMQQPFVCRHLLKNGEKIDVEIASHKINYYSINARLVLANDITKTLKYESELITAKEKAEKSEQLKTAFLANMSHEIRTPLNGIIGFSQLLNERYLDKEIVKKYSGFIAEGGNRLLELLSNILNVSKIESGVEVLNLNDFFVNDFISSIFTQFILQAKAKNLDYNLTIPIGSDEVHIMTDSMKLGQVFTNFLSNSFKFTKTGFIEFGYNYNDTEIEFFVKDSGIGIDSDQQELIFERFYQTDTTFSNGHEGAGLGLAICKGFAKLMNAKIRIESFPGKGSTFYLTLPLNIQK